MSELVLVTIPLVVEADRLWSEVFGGGYEFSPVACRVRFEEGTTWDKAGRATVGIEDPNDETKLVRATVGIQDLAEAYGKLVGSGYHHCGASLDLDSFDACSSFDMLQMVVFGELVYG